MDEQMLVLTSIQAQGPMDRNALRSLVGEVSTLQDLESPIEICLMLNWIERKKGQYHLTQVGEILASSE